MDIEPNIEPPHASTPVACTLTTKDAATQALEWVDLQHRATEISAIDGGVRMQFPASFLDDVQDLVRRERSCCAFLVIDTSVVDQVLTVDISSPNPDALPVISALAGLS